MKYKKLKKILFSIPDGETLPDEYYRKYTNNWRSQKLFIGKVPSGRAWIMWFLDKYVKEI